jgi:hypothetical protein
MFNLEYCVFCSIVEIGDTKQDYAKYLVKFKHIWYIGEVTHVPNQRIYDILGESLLIVVLMETILGLNPKCTTMS